MFQMLHTMLRLLGLGLILCLVLVPFVMMRMPWAVRLWRRIRLIALLYVLIVLTSGIVRLVLNWDAIYG